MTSQGNEQPSTSEGQSEQIEYSEGLVIPADGGEAVWLLDELIVFKVGGPETDDAIGFIEVTARPYGGPPQHLHQMQVEAFYVLEGVLTVRAGSVTQRAGQGALVVIPPGVSHAYRVEGGRPAKLLAMYTPPGLLNYFKEVGEIAPVKTLPPQEHVPDVERYVERGIRYFTEIVGTPI